jgi:hypothetical protein
MTAADSGLIGVSTVGWGRFYETVSAEIYEENKIWSNLSLELWP